MDPRDALPEATEPLDGTEPADSPEEEEISAVGDPQDRDEANQEEQSWHAAKPEELAASDEVLTAVPAGDAGARATALEREFGPETDEIVVPEAEALSGGEDAALLADTSPILDATPPENGPSPESQLDGGDELSPTEPVDPQWVLPKKPRVSVIEDGYYAGRDAVGDVGRLGTTQPTLVARNHRGSQHRADTVIDAFQLGCVRVAAASLRGMSHHALRGNRQDSYSLGSTRDEEWLVAVIADGVSEGRFSEIAADVAAELGVKQTLNHLDNGVRLPEVPWGEISERMGTAVRERARGVAGRMIRSKNGSPEDADALTDRDLSKVMATTAEILVVATCPDGLGRHSFARVVIAGDGSGFVMDPERGWQVIGIGKDLADGLVSHAVRPLPMPVVAPEVQDGEIVAGQAVVVVTDGYGGQMVDGSSAFASYLHSRLVEPLDLVAYLHAASYLNNSANDDRTIVTVWACQPEGGDRAD